ncbi:hypothetical protein AAC387_Pa02g1707 [Persea americana]
MASRLLHLSKFSVLLPISNVMFDIGGPEKSLCPTFILWAYSRMMVGKPILKRIVQLQLLARDGKGKE